VIAIYLFLALLSLSGSVSGAVFLKNGSDVTGNDVLGTIVSGENSQAANYSIDFFYDIHCGACHLAMTYLNEYRAAHPEIAISYYDIFNNTENRALFEQYKKAYHRSYVSVPVVFIGNAGLEGESAIREHYENLVAWYEKDRSPSPNQTGIPVSKTGAGTHRTVISIPLVLLAGILDGINPCACAVLIFLLIFLLMVREKSRVLPGGIAFSIALFFFYFLLGVGLIPFSRHSDIVIGSSLLVGTIAVIAGILLTKNALFPGIGPQLVPTSARNTITRTIKRQTLPIAFCLGFFTGIFELPCTGGIYRAILDMISFRVNITPGLIYLTLYNLAFIGPLLVITGLVYWKMPSGKVIDWKPEKKRAYRIFISLLLFLFAFFIITGVI
jgi:cytochrome c biogenesis protein CcdA